jgi:dTDP-4-amino-4,6-dideoxygalactose transaminase
VTAATRRVPLSSPYVDERDEELVLEVLRSGRLSLGPAIDRFEELFAERVGAPYAAAVSSGTAGLHLLCRLAGLAPGDEAITSPYSFVASANCAIYEGATPVFADIDPVTLNVDPEDVAARITDRTKALMPVHLFGRPAALAELAELGVPIVEDAAQAFGAAGVAQTGVASTFSFFPTKNLFGLGDGGLIAVRDEELAERIRLLRFHGSKAKKDFHHVGYNSRLDELQAAVLRLFLGHLDGWNEARREAAARYAELGLGEVCELPADDPAHVYHMFVVRTPERDRIATALKEAEIACAPYYVTPLHLQPALRFLGYREGDLPATEQASRENLALPLWAGIGADVQERVVSTVREAVGVGVR